MVDPPRRDTGDELCSTPNNARQPQGSTNGVLGASIQPGGSSAADSPAPGQDQFVSAPVSSSRGHTGGALYACGDCGRRYSRPEHLQRHVQTHTLGRRFSCQVCGKSFARADLKKRHEANHENNDSPRNAAELLHPQARDELLMPAKPALLPVSSARKISRANAVYCED